MTVLGADLVGAGDRTAYSHRYADAWFLIG
jgi:hypothetical protein